MDLEGTMNDEELITVRKRGDQFPRLAIEADGTIKTGPGNSVPSDLVSGLTPIPTSRRYYADRFHPGGVSLPTIGASTGIPFWALDATTQEVISCRIPAEDLIGWTAATVELLWFNPVTGTPGNVVYFCEWRSIDPSASIISGYTNLDPVVSSAVDNYIEVLAPLGSISITPGRDIAFRFARVAADAADTLPHDAWFTGIRLTRTA